MKRGEVWVANLNPSRGREVGKVRPVLVIQNDALVEAGSPTIAVLPLTTQVQPTLKLLPAFIYRRETVCSRRVSGARGSAPHARSTQSSETGR